MLRKAFSVTMAVLIFGALLPQAAWAPPINALDWYETYVDPVVNEQDGQVTDNDEWAYANWQNWSDGGAYGTVYSEFKRNWIATASNPANTALYAGITLFDLHDYSSAVTTETNDYNIFEYDWPNGTKVKLWILAQDNDPDDTDWLTNAGLQTSGLIPEGAGNDSIDDRGFIVRLNDNPASDVHWFPGMDEPGDPTFNWDDWYGLFGTWGFNNSAWDRGLPQAINGANEVYEVAIRVPDSVGGGEDPPEECITEIFKKIKDPKNGAPTMELVDVVIGPGHVGLLPGATAYPQLFGGLFAIFAGTIVLARKKRPPS